MPTSDRSFHSCTTRDAGHPAALTGKRIAVWGSYRYGNYGDDLMAVVFARHLQLSGAIPRVYGLPQDFGQRYGFEVTSDVGHLIHGSDCCVVGGGAWLASDVPRAVKATTERQREFLDFVDVIAANKCPTFMISVGSDGNWSADTSLSLPRQRLLECGLCRFATVRLPHDGDILARFKVPSRYFPDVLLDAGRLCSVSPSRPDDGRFHVGLNLPRQNRTAASVYRFFTALHPNVCVHFIDTVRARNDTATVSSDYFPTTERGDRRHHTYEDPVETLRFIATLDLVITHKLHLGVTALSLGIPYLCFGGLGKCRAFLESIGSGTAYHVPATTLLGRFGQIWRLLSPKSVNSSRSLFDYGMLKTLRDASHGHLDCLDDCVRAID